MTPKNVYDNISRRYVFVFVGNDDSRVTSAEFIKRDVEMGGGRAIREIGLNFHIFHLFGKIHITYIFHYLGHSKNTIKAGGSTASARSKMCEWVMGDGWVIPYQIIVADAADAVSANFSGRCNFLQI